MMIYCVNAWREGGQAERSGLYAAFSDNGLDWPRERRQQIWKVPVIAHDRPRSSTASHLHSQQSEPDGRSRPRTGGGDAPGWLYYGYSADWGHQAPHTPHYLMRRSLAILGNDP